MGLPTVRQLTYFLAVADAGRFNLAAERVNVSQPALSEQVAELERILGVRLFERGRHGATLTPLGEETASRARRILAALHELRDVVDAGRRSLGGLLKLGALPTIGPYLLPHVVPRLKAQHPDLRLHVREMRMTELQAGLRDGAFDVIVSTPPDGEDGLVVEPLFDEPLRLGLPAGHALAQETMVTLDRLAGEDLLTLESGHHLSMRVRGLAEAAKARLLVDYEGTSLDGLRQMVGLGMGVSLFPALYIRSEMASEEAVVVRDVALESGFRRIALIWRRSSPRADDFRALARLLRDTGEPLLRAAGET